MGLVKLNAHNSLFDITGRKAMILQLGRDLSLVTPEKGIEPASSPKVTDQRELSEAN